MVFNASNDKFKLERIPTGILSLDLLLSGGIPLGRWFELYGDYSTLKTTIALRAIANCHKLGFAALYCDVERSITKNFLEKCGINPKNTANGMLDIIQADTGEEYIDVIRQYLQSEQHKLIVIDSIAAMLPNREERMYVGKKVSTAEPMGSTGMLTSRMTRVLTSANKHNTGLVIINQTREKMTLFGDNTTTPGGKAPKFYAGQSVRLVTIKRTKTQGGRGTRKVTDQHIAAMIEKDKTSGNMGKETMIIYDQLTHSIDHAFEALTLGVEHGIIKRKGRTYTYAKKQYKKDDLLRKFKNEKILDKVQRKIREAALN